MKKKHDAILARERRKKTVTPLPETAQPAESGSLQAAGSPTLRQRVENAEAEALSWMLDARTAGDRSLQLAIGKTGTALVELLVLLDAREKESGNEKMSHCEPETARGSHEKGSK